MMNAYKKYNDVRIGSLLLFVRTVARVKSIRVERDIDREPIAFCTRRCACKRYKSRTGRRSGALAFYMCWFVKCACDRE
jgi:hypothetical protein